MCFSCARTTWVRMASGSCRLFHSQPQNPRSQPPTRLGPMASTSSASGNATQSSRRTMTTSRNPMTETSLTFTRPVASSEGKAEKLSKKVGF